MAALVLLVHDDLATIATVRRLLTEAGHEVILATSAADAVIAFGHYLPQLVILSPGVEGGRGGEVIDELGQLAEHRPLRVLLLGGQVPGFDAPVVSLPVDCNLLLEAVEDAMRFGRSKEEGAVAASPLRHVRLVQETSAVDAPLNGVVAAPIEEARAAPSPASDEEASGPSNAGTATSRVRRPRVRRREPRRVPREPSLSDAPVVSDMGLPESGTVSLEDLARLAVRLADTHGPACLELRAEGAARNLWFENGALIAADSSLRHESLPDRARRDGLIDSRQHSSLRLMRGMSTAHLVQLLKDRGYIREEEAAPLVRRHAEQIALEALSESRSDYRLTADPPAPGVPIVVRTRPLLGIVVDAVRRSLDGAKRLALLGGLTAIPSVARGAEQYLSELELGEREDRFLACIDGEATLEEILLAVGLREGPALKLLAALVALGWLEVRAPEIAPGAPPPPTLEIERLEVKFQEVQEADYFAILGLSRAAGGEEVQRAFAQLSAEFDPLKYAGHPDATVHHRAREVQEALSEAAHVLRDDRLRASYSRHLVD
jgi:CheY-like chemotaxis protein